VILLPETRPPRGTLFSGPIKFHLYTSWHNCSSCASRGRSQRVNDKIFGVVSDPYGFSRLIRWLLMVVRYICCNNRCIRVLKLFPTKKDFSRKCATEKGDPKKHLSLSVAICDWKHGNRIRSAMESSSLGKCQGYRRGSNRLVKVGRGQLWSDQSHSWTQ